MTLCIITPRLPPAMDGLGDHSLQLWRHIHNGQMMYGQTIASSNGQTPTAPNERSWHFLVLEGSQASRALWPEVSISEFSPSKDSLLKELESAAASVVLLQYVGYGYSVDGAPFWLNDALEEFKSRHKQSKIIVMFHETWASGKPWKREFWQSSAQKRCARRLLSVASRVVTSVRRNAQSLKTLRAHEPILLIPIGSSFNTQERTQKNWKHLLIFGQEYARGRAVNVHKRLIEALDRASSIETIILAGQIRDPSRDQSRELLAGLNLKSAITTCYNFSSDAIPDAVRECGLALMHTQSVFLLKSTAFQLAAQLGQVAITLEAGEADPPFQSGRHYLSYRSGGDLAKLIATIAEPETLLSVSANLAEQGRGYLSWPNIAQSWAKLLSETIEEGERT